MVSLIGQEVVDRTWQVSVDIADGIYGRWVRDVVLCQKGIWRRVRTTKMMVVVTCEDYEGRGRLKLGMESVMVRENDDVVISRWRDLPLAQGWQIPLFPVTSESWSSIQTVALQKNLLHLRQLWAGDITFWDPHAPQEQGAPFEQWWRREESHQYWPLLKWWE